MVTNQLDYLGKEASRDYLTRAIPLNESITKIAEHNALNREQINRVVESANTSTYLALFKTAEDKYIEFPVADSEKIAEMSEHKVLETETLDDYATPPQLTHSNELSIFPTEDVQEKTASVNETERLQFYQRLRYADNQLKEKLAALSGTFTEETSSLYSMVKQAVLQGQSFGHIKYAMEQHLPGKITEVIVSDIENDLRTKDRIYDLDMTIPEKIAEAVNKDNELLKKLDNIHEISNEFVKVSNYLKLVGATIDKGGRSAGKAGKFLITHPKTVATGLAVGAGTIVGYKSGKAKSDVENSALNKKPVNYKKR